MRSIRFAHVAALLGFTACTHNAVTRPDATSGGNVVSGPQQTVQWGPAPVVFPPGAQFAVMQGDPSKAGEPFTVRLRFPDGYLVPPHTHPTEEDVTVLSGTFLAGMGASVVESDLHPFGRGDFAAIPANHAHYAKARGETIVQVTAIGPFALTYVNPDGTPVSR
jgi:quercetin dioxygenase-like cupin family protein